MAITVKEIRDKKVWEEYILSRPEANFLHSWYWGEFYQNIDHQIVRHGYYDDDKLVGVLLFIIENAKRGRHGIVPAGPIIDWDNKSLVKFVFKDIRSIGKAKKCVFVRIRPQLLDNPESRQLFKSNGLRPAPMHLHAELTWQTDLDESEDYISHSDKKSGVFNMIYQFVRGFTLKNKLKIILLKISCLWFLF